MTLFCPATGQVQAKGVLSAPNMVLHPWLQEELQAILAQLDSAPFQQSISLPNDHPLMLAWKQWWSNEDPRNEHATSVGEVAQTLLGVAPSASTISRLTQNLTQQFEAWRQRRLHPHWRVLYLDGIHFSIRHGEKADSTIILTALAVDLEGNKEVLADLACAEEGKDGWGSRLQDLRSRGATKTRSDRD